MTPRVIAIAGRKGSGKTTLANILLAEDNDLDHEIVLRSFADDIKEAISRWFKVYSKDGSAIGLTGRQLYQKLGAACRGIDPTWWIEIWRMRTAVDRAEKHVIVDDVRYENELSFLKSLGALTIRLKRDPGPPDPHESEHGLDSVKDKEFDVVVPKDATPEQAVKLVSEALAIVAGG